MERSSCDGNGGDQMNLIRYEPDTNESIKVSKSFAASDRSCETFLAEKVVRPGMRCSVAKVSMSKGVNANL
jgi:hypothetical protein